MELEWQLRHAGKKLTLLGGTDPALLRKAITSFSRSLSLSMFFRFLFNDDATEGGDKVDCVDEYMDDDRS